MNRPADKRNDDMEVFILNGIFIHESYQPGKLVGSRFLQLACFLSVFFPLVMQRLLNRLEHTSVTLLYLPEHTTIV